MMLDGRWYTLENYQFAPQKLMVGLFPPFFVALPGRYKLAVPFLFGTSRCYLVLYTVGVQVVGGDSVDGNLRVNR